MTGPFRNAALALSLTALLPATALADVACDQVAGILGEAVEEWPNLLSTARIKPRMAVVKIGTSAGVALAYARDAGWTEDEMAPVAALRDTRELPADDPDNTKQRLPAVLHGHLIGIAGVLGVKCPQTETPDISGLSTVYPSG